MRFVEILTIYLAAGASVGVGCFLRLEARSNSRPRAMGIAFLAALFFPLTLILAFDLHRRQSKSGKRSTNENDFDSVCNTQIEHTKRALIDEFHHIEERITETCNRKQTETIHQIISSALNRTESYVGLSIAVADSTPDAAPSTRETELCRIAGRTGEDLSFAGRCIHRRNIFRLRAHLENARDEFFYAIRAVRESVEKFYVLNPDFRLISDLATLMLQTYERAIELALLFDDRELVANLARERDAERTQLSQNMPSEPCSNVSTNDATPLFNELSNSTDLTAVLPARIR